MSKDNNAIDRIKSNQNRIQTTSFSNEENNFFNNPSNVGSYEEVEEGASGVAQGGGVTDKRGFNLLSSFKKKLKLKIFVALSILGAILLIMMVFVTVFTNEDLKGFFLTDNINKNNKLNGSSSSSVATLTGTKSSLAEIAKIYKSTVIENMPFFSDLKDVAKNYKSYKLEDGFSLTDGEFDIALVASTIHFNKFITDATILSGAFSRERMISNMGIATTRGQTVIPTYDIRSFYELAAVTLGTDNGIPDEQLRGITGHLVGSKVISACVDDNDSFLSSGRIGGFSLLDSIIIKYEGLYYSNVSTSEENDFTRTLERRLEALRKKGTFSDYYDTTEYDPNINCGNKKAVHYVQKYMNYKTYAKYLLTEYVPENYLECLDCKSSNKRKDTIEITKKIFESRNQFVDYYYNTDLIDIQKFVNGDTLTTTKTEYQLPDAVKENFTSPFGLTTKCSISSGFTSNRTGYSHYAVDAYANDRTLYSVGDGVVIATVSNVKYSLNVINGVCLDSNGNIDYRSSGNYVAIKHVVDGKEYVSYYMHMESVSVKPGQTVHKGEKIGVEGTTGCSTGYHVHFQLVSGETRYDPTLLFAQCEGSNVINYSSSSMSEFLNKTLNNYTFTNINGCNVRVYNDKKKTSYSAMTLENYVAGVVNAEMPSSYNIEALKAQAIAARTFHVSNSNYCTKEDITLNSSSYQNYQKIDTKKNKSDNFPMFATRETTGMLATYSSGVYMTEYANFPCEIVYRCKEPDRYEPYYLKYSDSVTCYDTIERVFDSSKLYKTNNAKEGTEQAELCLKDGSKGSFYYCGESKYPRQFRNQSNIKGEVGDCDTISVELKPHYSYGNRYRSMAAPISSLKGIFQGSSWKEDYSTYGGHNRGMMQVLANYYANSFGWNYKRILDYFYGSTIDENLFKVDTPTILLDDQTEYEANDYNGKITITIGKRKLLVPVDYYVAGMINENFGPNGSSNLLKALAVSGRTWVYNKTRWGLLKLDPTDQYSFDYTDSKTVYDAVNGTKNTLLIDNEGYVTPTEFYHNGSDGTVNITGKEQTITYELGYQYSDDTHKVMIEYDEDNNPYAGLSSGNVGLIYNIASYLTKKMYFVDHYELLKFFYGEGYNVVNIDSMPNKGESKDEYGNIIKYQGGTIKFLSSGGSLNSDLESYVNSRGYGTIDGVLAAAEWLWANSQEDGWLYVPYKLGGQKTPYIGVYPPWTDPNNTSQGVDCVGFLYWSFVNGGYPKTTFVSVAGKLSDVGQFNSNYYYEFEPNKKVKRKGIPLIKYLNNDEIAPGDVLWHPQGTIYSDSGGEGSKYAHVAIVSEVDKENGTITIIHASSNNMVDGKMIGIRRVEIDARTGRYPSGNSHTYTTVMRFSQIEKGWLY